MLSQLELLPPPLETGQSKTFNQYETGDQKQSAKTDSDWSENEEDKIESRWRTLEREIATFAGIPLIVCLGTAKAH
jgi:hypothetical protein